MHFLHIIWVLCYLGRITLARNVVLSDDKEEETIICCDDDELFVTAEEGYQILITVETFNIPYNQGTAHYLLIKSGTNTDDGLDGIILTHYINTPREYLSLKNEVYINFVTINEETSKRVEDIDESEPIGEFRLIIRRVGEALTTTEPTTTEIPWPTPSPDESANITVNISGKRPTWYTGNNIVLFRDKVSKMAIKYCNYNDIETTEEISRDNVFIENIVQCPLNWPNRKDCVQITFRLPIFQEDQEEYLLNTENLEIMWLRYSDEYLEPELSNYGTPETSVFTLWLVIICATILLFSVVLYLFKRFSHKLSGVNIRKKSVNDNQDVVFTKAPRNDSLNPHPKQIVPGMFESENLYYDPDSTDNIR